MSTTFFEMTLDSEHRALIAMLRERRARPEEQAIVEGMSKRELGLALMHEFRFEPIRIPKDTPESVCRWCHAPIFWVPSRYGKEQRESVSIAGEPGECSAPTAERDGVGFSHLADCARSIYRTL